MDAAAASRCLSLVDCSCSPSLVEDVTGPSTHVHFAPKGRCLAVATSGSTQICSRFVKKKQSPVTHHTTTTTTAARSSSRITLLSIHRACYSTTIHRRMHSNACSAVKDVFVAQLRSSSTCRILLHFDLLPCTAQVSALRDISTLISGQGIANQYSRLNRTNTMARVYSVR
jgi:hypothetical protein